MRVLLPRTSKVECISSGVNGKGEKISSQITTAGRDGLYKSLDGMP